VYAPRSPTARSIFRAQEVNKVLGLQVQCKHFGEHHIGTSFHRPARYGDAVTAFATAASALVMAFTASSTS
jgi:hypothetical protein